MSDDFDPAAAVAAAQAEVAACQKAADAAKDRCLAAVADGLYDRIDALGKRIAKKQPDVAEALGSTGVGELRADLADVATTMAADLLDARDRITWSDKNGEVVHSSLFKYLHGPRLKPVEDVLKAHGFDTSHQVSPQDLYERKDEELSVALSNLQAAQAMLKNAVETQKQQAVDDLWN